MKVFITGLNGQDGSYLAEHCLKRGFEVGGLEEEVQLLRIKHSG